MPFPGPFPSHTKNGELFPRCWCLTTDGIDGHQGPPLKKLAERHPRPLDMSEQRFKLKTGSSPWFLRVRGNDTHVEYNVCPGGSDGVHKPLVLPTNIILQSTWLHLLLMNTTSSLSVVSSSSPSYAFARLELDIISRNRWWRSRRTSRRSRPIVEDTSR